MSSPIQPSSIASLGNTCCGGSAENDSPAHAVGREQQLAAGLAAGLDGAGRRALAVLVLVQRVADLPARGDRERVGHRAADEDRVGRPCEALDHPDLVGDLDAARDDHERVRRRVEQLAEHLELAAQEVSRGRREQLRDRGDRRVRAMDRAERIVDVDVGERRERDRELGSFASSPGWNRRFSSSRTSPSASACTACSATGPTQSDANST